MATPVRKSFIAELLRRGSSKRDVTEEADAELDGALERLSRSLEEHAEVSTRVRRRGSSGSLKIVSVPTVVD